MDAEKEIQKGGLNEGYVSDSSSSSFGSLKEKSAAIYTTQKSQFTHRIKVKFKECSVPATRGRPVSRRQHDTTH